MSASESSSSSDPKKGAKKSPTAANPQDILEGFRKLREQQQFFASKIGELETERNEHRLVIETLSSTDEDRKCFRLMGGVLVERTVKEVLPALKDSVQKIGEVLDTYNENLVTAGKQLNEYREKHKIRFMNEEEKGQDKKPTKPDTKNDSSGVLVG